MPVISVIVPVYHVEPWLPKCLDSILAQTFRDLEVILVDDGSTDRSGQICDEYAARDGRVRVIHQENRGCSAARNRGLQAASGQWLSFIDSDDWIDERFYETLHGLALEYGADIASCGYYINGQMLRGTGQVVVYEGKEIQYQLLEMHFAASSLCNKLYRAELKPFLTNREDIHFTEDFNANYRVNQQASRMVFKDLCLYHYTMRRTGCVYHFRPEDNRKSVQLAEELADLERGDERAYAACLHHCIILRLTEINQTIKYSPDRSGLRGLIRELGSTYGRLKNKSCLTPRERASVLALRYAPGLYVSAVRRKFKKHGV